MPIQKLAKAGAMGVGSELWIVPNPEASPWARKIDWYLNFQMARASQHPHPRLAPELEQLIKDNEIEFNDMSFQTESLMVATQARLPAEQIVLVPFSSDKIQWIKTGKKIWESLNHPRLRLFLPLGVKDTEIQKIWAEHKNSSDEVLDLTIVPGDLPLDA